MFQIAIEVCAEHRNWAALKKCTLIFSAPVKKICPYLFLPAPSRSPLRIEQQEKPETSVEGSQLRVDKQQIKILKRSESRSVL